MKMQTIHAQTRQPHDFSFFKHGTTGIVRPANINGKLIEDDPVFEFENGQTIFVASLRKAGADIVPFEVAE